MALRIKEIREAKGLSQQRLAELAGISRPQLSQIETGTRPANTLRLSSIARALRVPVDQLFTKSARPEDDLIIELMRHMSDEDRAALVRYARAMSGKA